MSVETAPGARSETCTVPVAPTHVADDYEFDVYVCCAKEDEEFVQQEIISSFEAAHVRYTWEPDFRWGVDLTVARSNAIDKSRHIMAVLTPAWCNCAFATDDALTARFRDPGAFGRKILPLYYQPCKLPAQLNLDRLKGYDFSTAEIRKTTLSKMLSELGRSSHEVSEVIDRFHSGLAAFIELMTSAEVRAAVRGIENAFKATNQSMGELSRCKHMHEFFHQASEQFIEFGRLRDKLEDAVGNCHVEQELENEAESGADLEEAWDTLRAFVDEKLISSIDNLLGLTTTKQYRDEQLLWLPGITRIREELKAACDDCNRNKLRRCSERLSNLLNQWTGRFDQQLLEAAKGLQLSVIVEALQCIEKRAQTYNFTPEIKERIEVLCQGIEAVVELNERLQSTVVCHNCLQYVDQILQLLTNRCRNSDEIDKIRDAWEQIEPAVTKVMTLQLSGNWVSQLEQTSRQLKEVVNLPSDEDMDTKLIASFNRAYTRFRGTARTSFTQVDLALLDMCNRLDDIQGSLNKAIQSLEK